MICTDHDALKWILNRTDFTGQLARWHLRLSNFDFHDEHRAGIKRQAADALSRLSTFSKDESSLKDDLPLYAIDNFDSLPI